jgi:hypothetical protein
MKKIINSVLTWVTHLFKGLTPALKKAVHIGVVITDAIKTFDTANPLAADIVTAIIPGDLDDKVKERLRANLPKIVIQLKLVDATLGLTNPGEILIAASKMLQQITSDWSIREGFLNNLSIVIAQVASDGKLTWNDAAYLLKWYYDNEYQKQVAIAA